MKLNYFNRTKSIVVWSGVGVFAFMQILLSIQTAFLGESLNSFKTQNDKLVNENNKIMAELSDKQSLLKVGALAENLGFSTQKSVVFIDKSENLASLP